jgi:hypothetical protein
VVAFPGESYTPSTVHFARWLSGRLFNEFGDLLAVYSKENGRRVVPPAAKDHASGVSVAAA